LKEAIATFREKTPESKISLFIEANIEHVDTVKSLNIDAVEIHTGDYAKDDLEGKSIDGHLELYKNFFEAIKDSSISFHAGHGLTDKSLAPLVEQALFSEYNIGHWIISQSVFEGMSSVIEKLVKILEKK
jgi:pyridoxine 5-phosphate synthase